MLQGIKRGEKRPPRVVIYGPPKIGKSTFGSDSLAPVFVCTEEGVDNLPVDQYPMARSWDELLGNLKTLATEEHEYKTVVLDTLNGAGDLAAQAVCASQFKGNWGPGGFQSFGQGWAATSEEIRRLLGHLDTCRAKGMTCLLLAHAGVQNVKNPVAGDFTKYTPDLDKRVWSRVAAWSDIIGRAEFEHTLLEDKASKRSKAISSNTRIVHFAGSQAEDAGCRVGYGLPETLPLSYVEFAAALGMADDTGKQIAELWPLLNKDENTKTLAYLGIARLEDIGQAQSQKAKVVFNKLQSRKQKEAV